MAFALQEGRTGWGKELDDERAIGFDLLWLSHVAPVLAPGFDGDPLGDLLDVCGERNVQVILSTDMSHDWYVGPVNVEKEKERVGASIQAMAARYGGHPAFFAWYVPHEIYVAYGEGDAFIRELYAAAVRMCREALPGKPVTVSPFFILDQERIFGDFQYASPEEYRAYWTGLISEAGFDIVMLQDSGEHFSYVTNDQRRPFFAAMKAACDQSGAKLWGNVETAEFECPSIEDYVRRYGRVHHSTVKDAPWRAVPIERLASKLELASEYCERIVSWGYYQYGRPHLGPQAKRWYEDYRHYIEGVTS